MTNPETPEPESAQQEKQPLAKHLIELRKRLIWIFLVMAVGTGICFVFVEHIYGFLVTPLANAMGGASTNRLI